MAKAQTLKKHPMDRPWRVLLWGPAKQGKTVRAHTFPRTRTLDFDDGMLSVMWGIKVGIIKKDPDEIVYATIREGEGKGERGKHGYINIPAALDRATDQIDEWLKDEDWDTLIVDSATSLNMFCLLKGTKSMGDEGYSESWAKSKKMNLLIPRIQDYGGAKNLFLQFVEWVLSIDRNVVITCHVHENTTGSGIIRSYQPLLIGSLREEIPKMFDEVWYNYMTTDDDKFKVMIKTRSDKQHRCGSRLGCLDPEESAFSYAEIVKKVNTFWGSVSHKSGAKTGTKVSVAVS